MKLKVGNVVTLAMPMLNEEIGTRGVVYDTYDDFEDKGEKGASIIFEHGNYDGFSYEDQQVFLNEEKILFVPFYIREYKFENVMKLAQDFKKGYWGEIFV